MHEPTCNHTMDSGRPCGSPPLHGKPFCYWHHRLRQDFSVPGTPNYRPPLLESPNSVLIALNHVYIAQARNLIDPRLARNLQSTLRIALQCFRQLDQPDKSELATNPADFGANFGPPREIDIRKSAGVPSPASVAEGGVVRSAGDSPAVVPTTSSAVGVSRDVRKPAGAPSSAAFAEGELVKTPGDKNTAGSSFNPFVIPERPAKDRYYDPVGCLAHLHD